jgi:predicted transposase YdaD
LAGLKLGTEVIERILRRDIMEESKFYRDIQAEAAITATINTKREIALNLLQQGLAIERVAAGTGLSIEEVQHLQQQSEA